LRYKEEKMIAQIITATITPRKQVEAMQWVKKIAKYQKEHFSLCQPQITQNDMCHVVTGTTIDFATGVHPRAA